MARHPACPAQVFWLYNKVVDGGDVVIQKQGFAIADRHASVTATNPSPFSKVVLHPHRNKILLVGYHQGGCRSRSPGLHRIKSVSSRCGVVHSKRRTSTLHGSFLPTLATILFYRRAFRMRSRKLEGARCGSMVGRSDDGHAFK